MEGGSQNRANEEALLPDSLSKCWTDLRRRYPARIVGVREQLRCDYHRREQINKRYANPHEGARILLILKRRNSEMPIPWQVARIDNALA
ncbi:MAG: hypothetical protein QOJ41_1810, partial [Acidobacteriaceae bacterium]|nr:hypothetical protein [Acidobacteriaceae bacterium]